MGRRGMLLFGGVGEGGGGGGGGGCGGGGGVLLLMSQARRGGRLQHRIDEALKDQVCHHTKSMK